MNTDLTISDICNLITGINCDRTKCLHCPMCERGNTCGLVKIKERLIQLDAFICNQKADKQYGVIDKGGLLIGGDITLSILAKARILGGWQTKKHYYRYVSGVKRTVLGGAFMFERLDMIELDDFENRVKRNQWETVYFSYK